jgi:hypothetical protein
MIAEPDVRLGECAGMTPERQLTQRRFDLGLKRIEHLGGSRPLLVFCHGESNREHRLLRQRSRMPLMDPACVSR